MQPPPAEFPVKPADIPGRGRGLIATRTIKPGEIILVDSPLLLYPSSLQTLASSCSSCFRSLPQNPNPNPNPNPNIPCPSSCPSLFCSPSCLSSHPSPLCSSLRHLPPAASSDDLFLATAHSLSITSPDSFSRLLSLHGADLVQKDHLNAFGIMEGVGEERKVRAYGIYPSASLFNHDCLPNACRFDYVDGVGRGGRGNTDIIVRAVHEISEGREVCLSYFPVNWGYKERQRRLVEDYGFRCECDRCLVEREWKDEEEEGSDEGMEVEEEMEEEDGDFPHAYFFVKFVCDVEECGGTMAPLPPSAEGVVSDVMECNVCGKLRKDEDGDVDGDMVDDE